MKIMDAEEGVGSTYHRSSGCAFYFVSQKSLLQWLGGED